jgi:hypothetical protein
VTGAVANAVLIRRAIRTTSQRRLAAHLQVAPGTRARALRAVDRVAAVLDALGLEVCARP